MSARTEQIAEHRTEQNSGLGQAVAYLLNHWQPLTLFLREKGVPLDNNICERALKKAILNRKNAMFYKTLNGAWVGDLYMSLIHSCYLAGANPFDYLTELQQSLLYEPETGLMTIIHGLETNIVGYLKHTPPSSGMELTR
jgi:hypothetical protein